MSNALRSQELYLTRLLCPSLSHGVCSHSCPLNWWCNLTLSYHLPPSSPFAFSLCQHQGLFHWVDSTSGAQRIGASASASVLPMNIQGCFPLGLTGFIFAVQGTLKSLLQHDSSKASILWHSAFFMVQFSHPYSTTGKTIVWLCRPLMAKWSLWFLIHCLGLSQHFFQGASIF